MKIYAVTIIAVLAPLAAAEYEKPKNCKGTQLKDGQKARRNQAICIDDYRFGINQDGVFGLWDGNDLIESYMTGADSLIVTEKNSGDQAYLTLKNKNDKILWQVKCPDLDGDSTTKLQIKDRSANIVRFRQGDTLWEIDHDGDMEISNDCYYAGDKPEDKCKDGEWDVKEESNKCIKYWCDSGQWKWKEIDDHYCDEDSGKCDDPEWEVKKEDGKCMKYWWCEGDAKKQKKQIDDKYCEEGEECKDGDWDLKEENKKCIKYWCEGGKWMDKEIDDYWCDNEGDECKDGDWGFKHDEKGNCIKYWCDDGKWDWDYVKDEECDEKDKCKDGDWELKEDGDKCIKYWCEDGKWKDKEIEDYYCKGEECKDGESGYKHDEEGFCIRYWCDDGKWDWDYEDEESCDEKPSGDYFLARNMAGNGKYCVKGSGNTRLRKCRSSDEKQVWKLNKSNQLVTEAEPKGCMYVDDKDTGEVAHYDDDCNKKNSYWTYTRKEQIQAKDSDLCLTYERPAGSPPQDGDRMILRSCKDDERFQYELDIDL